MSDLGPSDGAPFASESVSAPLPPPPSTDAARVDAPAPEGLPPGYAPAPSPPPPPPAANRLVITAEDLAGPTVSAHVDQMRQATTPQLVRPVGAPGSQKSGLGPAVSLGVAGVVGGLVGWGASELISQPYAEEQAYVSCFTSDTYDGCDYKPWYGDSPITSAMVFVIPFALILGAVIAGWDGIVARSGAKFWSLVAKAGPLLLVGSAVGSWLGAEYYKSATKTVTESSQLHFPRGVAWAMFSVGVGTALGAASKSSKRAVNGALGGAIGGFVGGFVFDYIDLSDTNAIPNRLVGLTITGAVIGLAIGLVETARREHWLEIVSGGMAGKQFILYNDMTTIGSGHDAGITLIKDPGIAAQHAYLQRDGAGLKIRSVNPAAPVQVNGVATLEQLLNEGDLVQMGSTVVRYRSKQAAMPTGMPHLAGGVPPMPPPTP